MLGTTDKEILTFLRARLADTARAQESPFTVWHSADCTALPDAFHREGSDCNCGIPASVLRDVEAKRRQLDDLLPELSEADDFIAGEWGHDDDLTGKLLRVLALAYAEHPEYNAAEWQPW